MQSSNKSFAGDLDRLIFFGSEAGIISLCVPLALFPEQGGVILGKAFDFLTQQEFDRLQDLKRQADYRQWQEQKSKSKNSSSKNSNSKNSNLISVVCTNSII